MQEHATLRLKKSSQARNEHNGGTMIAEHLKQLETFVGPRLQVLLRGQEATEVHIDDPDPKMRWAALILLTHHWGLTDKLKQKCEEMAVHDPDDLVRSKAVGSLGTCFAGTGNRRILSLLANIVFNQRETHALRRSAYIAIFAVHGQQSMPPPARILNLRIPEDVDWAFVQSMQGENQRGRESNGT